MLFTRLRASSLGLFALLLPLGSAQADPQLTSWLTANSGKYARIYASDADRLSGTTQLTWTSRTGQISQALPAYVGVQKITYSASWVYFNTTNLGPYNMGPWYDDATRTLQFINLPKNQNLNYRVPRTATLGTPPATKSSTQGMEDAIGFFVDGVAMFDPTDGFTYNAGAEASPGTGQWHRDAYVNEKITFDPGNTHQQNTGKYHNHADPLALRYLAGDHVTFEPVNKTYAESTATPTQHSPILGWMRDGYPIYGPYGYRSALDSTSGIRRMVSGFVKRDGATGGVDNINAAGRTLPAWATRNNGNITAAGPAVSTTYPFGRYIEDNAYLGDLTKPSTGQKYVQGVDFDLNEYNVRFCVTPEFPGGTYAYFICVDATGTPTFPYNANRYFFGNPTGGTATAAETVTTYFQGGPDLLEAARMTSVNSTNGNAAVTWTSVEGGTYKVEATSSLTGTWSTLSSTQAAASNASETTYSELGAASNGFPGRFYRVTRTALATYDTGTGTGTGTEGISSVAPISANHGATVTLTVVLNSNANPAPPPSNVLPTSAALTRGTATINASTYTRNTTTGVVTLGFTIPANATVGAYNVNVTFGPNTWSLTNGFAVN